MISERSITGPPIPYYRSRGRPTILGDIEVFSLSSSSSTTTIISSCRWCGGGMTPRRWLRRLEQLLFNSRASERSSSLAACERNDASMPSCPKYQSDPGSGARQLMALWELALVTVSLERPWLRRMSRSVARWRAHRGRWMAPMGWGRGIRHDRRASGCGRRSSSLTVGEG